MSGWMRFEAAIGLLAAFLIGVVPWMVSLIFGFGLFVNGRFGLAFLALAVALPSAVAFHWLYHAARRHMDVSPSRDPACPPAHFPLALSMALQTPLAPRFSRYILAVWWMGHFSAGALFAHFSFMSAGQAMNQAQPVTLAFVALVQFAFTFAANLYLMLACGAVWPLHPRLLTVWRFRLLIDVGVVALLAIAWH